MVVNILGTGQSIFLYKKDGNLTIGVNDVARFVKPDQLVIVDYPDVFNKERMNIIKGNNYSAVYSQLYEWQFLPNFKKIELTEKLPTGQGRCSLQYLSNDKQFEMIPYSTNSPFVACCIAYRLGATSIIMYGVDFVNFDFRGHPELISETLDHYAKLHDELKKRGVSLSVASRDGILKSVLPVMLSL